MEIHFQNVAVLQITSFIGEGLCYIYFVLGWAVRSHVFSVLWSSLRFCFCHHPLHKESSLMRSESCTSIQVTRQNLESSLIPCPKIIVVALPQGHGSSPTEDIYGTIHVFAPLEWALNLIFLALVTPINSCPPSLQFSGCTVAKTAMLSPWLAPWIAPSRAVRAV